jgi:membrane protease YdiL (CAAX protease family)
MDEPASLSSLALMAVISAASFTALVYLFQRHIGGMPLVKYEPRRRVPWGTGFAIAAMLIPFAGIMGSILGSAAEPNTTTIIEELTQEIIEDEETAPAEAPNNFVFNVLFTSGLMILFVVVVSFILRDFVGADIHDLGLPENRDQFAADVSLGAFACLAAMLPIYMLQILLTLLLQPKSEHPMVEELQQAHTPAMMLGGVFMVVVAAPLYEEFTFRLLLQGWLEKWEDEHIGYSGTMRTQPAVPVPNEFDEPASNQDDEPAVLLAIPQTPVPLPRSGVLQDLTHGWLPILISGTFFGLAHWGHGVSPVPLVLFGIVLGYLYQRTHRLVPSITAHALFNAYSMMMLWLSL